MKVLRPDSVESFKSRDSSFSAGTKQPSLWDIPWSQRRPKPLALQSQARDLSPPSPKGQIVQEKALQFHLSVSSLLVSRTPSFLEQSSMAREAAPQPGVSVEGGRNRRANSTPRQANIKVRKWGFGSAESREPQSLPGSIGPTMSSALGTSSRFVTIRNPPLTGDGTSESPRGRAVGGTAFPLPSSPCITPLPCTDKGLPPPRTNNQGILRARLSQGSTIYIFRISGTTRWLGHKCPPWPAIRQGKDHSWTAGWCKDDAWPHQHRAEDTLFLLCRP